jgi:hypothetical protein
MVMRSTLADAPLTVSTDGTAGPYIIVTTEQMDPVVEALRAQRIHFETNDDAVMLDGRPALSVISLDHDADVERVQKILEGLVSEWRGERGRPEPARAAQNELIVRFGPSDSSEVVRRLESAPPDGWTRSREIEERMRTMRAAKAGAYCFTKNFAPKLGDVAVWLESRGSRELYVSSIIALKTRKSMDVGQYNQVLDDFEKTFIEALMNGMKRYVFSYQAPRGPTLEDVLSIDSMRRLKAFSATANKGKLHPLDMQRWHVFVARTHLENAVIEPSLLSEWLQCEGWPEEQRSFLIDDYELGRSLLSIYEEERAGR